MRFLARIHVMLKKDVADVQGIAIQQSLQRHGESVVEVRAGKYFEVEVEAADESAALQLAERLAKDVFGNPVIEHSTVEVHAVC